MFFFQGLSVFIFFVLAVLFLAAKNYSQLQEKDFTNVSTIYSNETQELVDVTYLSQQMINSLKEKTLTCSSLKL